MGKAKKGPPYLDEPDGKLIVISNPWGMGTGKNRKQFDYNAVGAWVRWMFRKEGTSHQKDVLVETVYARDTVDTVIVQLPMSVDVTPYLGIHPWARFLTQLEKPSDEQSFSYIFEYNYRNNGDPSNHNWSEYYPTSEPPPRGFPIRLPYPLPSWSERPPSIIPLALPLPDTRVRTPTPPPTPPEPEPEETKPLVKEEVDTLFLNKRDPYEQDNDALGLLRSPVKDESHEHSLARNMSKKEEEDDSVYRPSESLMESIALLNQSLTQPSVQVKTNEPEDDKNLLRQPSPEYRPSLNLVDAINQLQSNQASLQSNRRSTSHKRVKDEDDDLGPIKRIKSERY